MCKSYQRHRRAVVLRDVPLSLFSFLLLTK
nr:MAG TPA: hypothetical protein [Caudoviricetes sp.]